MSTKAQRLPARVKLESNSGPEPEPSTCWTVTVARPPYLSVSFVLVPDEPQLGVGGHAVVGSDVAVEQSALHPDRFTCQNMVLFQIHRPVEAAVH